MLKKQCDYCKKNEKLFEKSLPKLMIDVSRYVIWKKFPTMLAKIFFDAINIGSVCVLRRLEPKIKSKMENDVKNMGMTAEVQMITITWTLIFMQMKIH